MKKPTLLLLPNLLDEEQTPEEIFTPLIRNKIAQIDGLIAESFKEARLFLRLFTFVNFTSFREVPIVLLNEHTKENEIDDLLQPILQKQIWGLVSDAGLPCIADPGANLVFRAREKGIEIETFTGPCSIIMALQLSGLPAQSFCFHGYVPRKPLELTQSIKQWQSQKATHVFIETPYRSKKVLEMLVQSLPSSALLSVVWNLGSSSQGVITRSVQSWKKSSMPDVEDKKAVFLFSLKE